MAIGDENIGPAIVVVIEKEAAESKRDQSGAAYFGLRSLVHEQAVAFVVIKRNHLIGEVADDDAGVAAAIVIGGVHAHAGASHAIFAESYTRRNAALFERSVFLVQVKLVGLGVVGNQNIGPAVAVVIENGDAEAF